MNKAKGVQRSVIEKTITFDDYLNCLRNNSSLTREQRGIRSVHHNVRTERSNKIALSANDDKRHLILGQTDTLPHGHFTIMDDEMIQAVMDVEAQEAEMEVVNEERVDEMVGTRIYQDSRKRALSSPSAEQPSEKRRKQS